MATFLFIGGIGIPTVIAADDPIYYLGLDCLSGNFDAPGEDGNRGTEIVEKFIPV